MAKDLQNYFGYVELAHFWSQNQVIANNNSLEVV